MFRFDKEASEWKERGTGELKMLQHQEGKKIRIVMRRDKTLKICANHLILKEMELKPNVGSDRSWVYTAPFDLSEGAPQTELLAVRFANAENANMFKEKFEEAKKINSSEGHKGEQDTGGENICEKSADKQDTGGQNIGEKSADKQDTTEDDKKEGKLEETKDNDA